MKVQLEEGMWLADGNGTPPWALFEKNAKEFDTHEEASAALAKARTFREFKNATIKEDFF